jgi:hypothetical protein
LVPCLRIVHARQRQCHGRAHGCGHPRQRIFRGAERERHHRLHARRRFFGRLQQLPGHFRRTTSPGLSRGEWSGQYRRGDRAAAARRRDHQSADGNRQRRDNRQSDASAGLGTQFSTPVTIYDSLGASHTLTYDFTNTGPNTWSYSLSIPPADLNSVGGVPPTGILSTGTLTFNGNGALIGTGGGAGTAAYGGTNVGNGTISGLATTAATVTQTITATATSATTFAVVGSVSGPLGTATVGSPFTSGQVDFTIAAGSTAFAIGDTIHRAHDAPHPGERFRDSHHGVRRRRYQSDFQLERAQRNHPSDHAGRGSKHDHVDWAGWQQQRFAGQFQHRFRWHDYRLVHQRQDAGAGRIGAGEFRQRERTPARRHHRLLTHAGFGTGRGGGPGRRRFGNDLGRVAGSCRTWTSPPSSPTSSWRSVVLKRMPKR